MPDINFEILDNQELFELLASLEGMDDVLKEYEEIIEKTVMIMNTRYSEKINKINEDRKLILNMVKENLDKTKLELSDNINNIINALNYDEQNIEKYKNIINAKQLILELMEEISMANNIEEIVNLRKKINYYINKIKKELLKRKISPELLNKIV